MKVTFYYTCDKDGAKYIFSSKPEKRDYEWNYASGEDSDTSFCFRLDRKYPPLHFKTLFQKSIDFDSIPEPKWEDEEPIEIYLDIQFKGYGII